MRKSILLVMVVFFATLLNAKELHYSQEATLYQHLVTVNIQWKNQKQIPNWIKEQTIQFNTDTERIQVHLKLVEDILQNKTKPQQQKRKAALEKLKGYYQKGEFPTNLYHQTRQPYFVDHKDIHCAVGYLLQQTGELELVGRIRTENNYAYIHELTKYKRLEKWAKEYDFTIDELAWIQPTYPPLNPTFTGVGNGDGVIGQIYTMVQTYDSSMLYMAGDFTEVDGQLVDNIIGWDGTNWHTLGSGIDGVIYAIDFWQGNLVVAGDFTLNGQPCNVASWSNGAWSALQTGDMQGAVLAMKVYQNRVYIGGDFQMVSGNSMPYLAYLPPPNQGNGWINSSGPWANSINNAFSVDAPVRCFEAVNGKLLVGGDFMQTANLTSSNVINHLSVNYLAYWTGSNWSSGFTGQHSAVHTIKLHDNKIYVGGKVSGPNAIGIYDISGWTYFGLSPQGDNLVHQFVVFEDELYMVGGFSVTAGILGSGIFQFGEGGVTTVDNTVSAACAFKGKLYFGGDFQQIGNMPISNGLVATDMIPTDIEYPTVELVRRIEVRYKGGRTFLYTERFKWPRMLQIFDIQGRLVRTLTLNKGGQTIPLNPLLPVKGVYVYRLIEEGSKETGKIVIY